MTWEPHFSRTSSLAVWSMVCGIFTYVCFCMGFVPAIAAVLLGHFALSAIAESAGTLTGRGMAISGLILGYAGLGLSVMLIAFFPAGTVDKIDGRGLAKSDEMAVKAAVEAYVIEYGRLPASLTGPQDLTLSNDNSRLMDILRGRSPMQNPMDIEFFHEPKSIPGNPPRGTIGPDGVLYDRWGHPYFIRLDSDEDGVVDNPYTHGAGATPLRERVIIWSQGADGLPGNNGDGNGEADVLSWDELSDQSSSVHSYHFTFPRKSSGP